VKSAQHEAAGRAHSSIVKTPLNAGATVDPINDYCMTPLLYSAWKVHRCGQMLLEAGADTNTSVHQPTTISVPYDEVPYCGPIQDIGDRPLHSVARNGRVEMVRLLLDNGADPGAQSDRKEAALHRAIRWN
jgi:ankyrin repeat protein